MTVNKINNKYLLIQKPQVEIKMMNKLKKFLTLDLKKKKIDDDF